MDLRNASWTTWRNKSVGRTLGAFAAATEKWQGKNGYQNYWGFPGMQSPLRKLNVPAAINGVLDERGSFAPDSGPFGAEPGATPFEKIKNGFGAEETYTPQLLRAMKEASTELSEAEQQPRGRSETVTK